MDIRYYYSLHLLSYQRRSARKGMANALKIAVQKLSRGARTPGKNRIKSNDSQPKRHTVSVRTGNVVGTDGGTVVTTSGAEPNEGSIPQPELIIMSIITRAKIKSSPMYFSNSSFVFFKFYLHSCESCLDDKEILGEVFVPLGYFLIKIRDLVP